MENFATYISIDNNIRFGKPCIKGTRISISDVLQWFASGMSENEILIDYDYLTKEQIRAALAFAAHKEDFIKIIAA
ncbi:MAG: DUF433 domain-containing protein [Cytophagales bacterium]|nr:DUF433 domain-containing protein [Cytophagales bacterium]